MDNSYSKHTTNMQFEEFSKNISLFAINRILAIVCLLFVVASGLFLVVSYWLLTGSEYVEVIMDEFGIPITNFHIHGIIQNVYHYIKHKLANLFTQSQEVSIKKEKQNSRLQNDTNATNATNDTNDANDTNAIVYQDSNTIHDDNSDISDISDIIDVTEERMGMMTEDKIVHDLTDDDKYDNSAYVNDIVETALEEIHHLIEQETINSDDDVDD